MEHREGRGEEGRRRLLSMRSSHAGLTSFEVPADGRWIAVAKLASDKVLGLGHSDRAAVADALTCFPSAVVDGLLASARQDSPAESS